MKRLVNDYGSWLWPEKDTACCNAVFFEIPKLKEVIALTSGKNVAVQAGSNCGVFPSILSKHFEAVYTFEPDPTNFECLAANVPEHHVYKFPCALGKTNACIGLRFGPQNDETNCGALQVDGEGLTPTIKIDQLALRACDLIYLDVEGFELQTLIGGKDTIERYHPLIVTEEKQLGENFGWKDAEIGEFLAQFGYSKQRKIENDQIYQ